MGSSLLPVAAARYRTSAVENRSGNQDQRQDVRSYGAGTSTSLFVIQVHARRLRRVDRAPRNHPRTLHGAREMGWARVFRRYAAQRTRAAAEASLRTDF